jgi:hypothetical protein
MNTNFQPDQIRFSSFSTDPAITIRTIQMINDQINFIENGTPIPTPAPLNNAKPKLRRHDYSLLQKQSILDEALRAKTEPGNSIRKVFIIIK